MHLLRRQKLQMQAPSLLLETKYSKWRSAQRNSLLNEIEARPGCTPGREGRGCAPVRKKAVKRWLSQLYRSVLRGLCLPSGQLSDFFFPHLTNPRILPKMYVQLFFQDGFQPSGLCDPHISITYYGVMPLLLTPRSLSACEMSPLLQGWETHDVLIF